MTGKFFYIVVSKSGWHEAISPNPIAISVVYQRQSFKLVPNQKTISKITDNYPLTVIT